MVVVLSPFTFERVCCGSFGERSVVHQHYGAFCTLSERFFELHKLLRANYAAWQFVLP